MVNLEHISFPLLSAPEKPWRLQSEKRSHRLHHLSCTAAPEASEASTGPKWSTVLWCVPGSKYNSSQRLRMLWLYYVIHTWSLARSAEFRRCMQMSSSTPKEDPSDFSFTFFKRWSRGKSIMSMSQPKAHSASNISLPSLLNTSASNRQVMHSLPPGFPAFHWLFLACTTARKPHR